MKLSTQRWKGRLDAAIAILINRGISVQQGSTYNSLLDAVVSSHIFSVDEIRAFATLTVNGLSENSEGYDPDGEALGRIDYEYVHNHFPPHEVLTKLTDETDYAYLHKIELEQNKIKRKQRRIRNLKIVVSIVVATIIGTIIYNLPYFAEKRAYAQTLETPSIETFDKYIAKYHHPEHLPDVLYRHALFYLCGDSIYYEYSYEKARERQCIEALDSLIKFFPNHELSKKADEVIDSIWNNEISRYTQRNQNIQSSNSLSAMYEMLQYMKQNKIYNIRLNVKSDVDLKEYGDFPQKARDVVEYYLPELKENPVLKIKDYFGTPDQESLEQSLVQEFKTSFDSLFTPGFFSIITSDENDDAKSNLPVIDLGYSIKTQVTNMNGISVPDIWIYTAKMGRMTIHEDYIMGIEVAFDSKLSFPGQETPWEVSVKGSPEEDISNIDNIRDGYRVMIKRCFAKFGEQLYTLLGLSDEQNNTD